ncbi:hypothetical protein J8J27_32105, partial [Mycobacterium tuberculosis]|nr:hypothetical protein [Mycobacterium tuberculosis]
VTSCVIEPTDASPGDGKAKVRLTDAEKIALDALHNATVDHGKPAPTVAVPNGVHAVRIDDWRAAAYRRGLAEGEEAQRKAFQR